MVSKGFKLENIGEVISEGIQEIINSFSFNEELQPAYLSDCGCNNYSCDTNRECRCVDFYGCESNRCLCDPYDWNKDDCAKDKCAKMCGRY